jgi:hypothetical protein
MVPAPAIASTGRHLKSSAMRSVFFSPILKPKMTRPVVNRCGITSHYLTNKKSI